MENDKKQFGIFFTKNYDYILQNLKIPKNIKNIIEPFTGDGDLIDFIDDKSKYNIECYDIIPRKDFIIQRDTISNPPDYKNKFIITNPPYLARNKSKNKNLYDKYNTNDLYKCFIKEIINNVCLGGIIIIPLNFWSSIRKNDIELRKLFLEKYDIKHLNIFEEQVFEDTTYTICSFLFIPTKNNKNIPITIYPSNKNINIVLNKENNYIIGGDIYKLQTKNKYNITRLTSKNIDKKNTDILVKCIDDISLSISNKPYIDTTPNQSARTYATLIIEPSITPEQQKNIVSKFNQLLNDYRNKYNSLFLTNYRELSRKRISFDLVYKIVEHILDFHQI
jgi:hypothetical protein